MLEQRAILVGVNLKGQPDVVDSMEELTNLSIACDVDVMGEVVQNLNQVDRAYYIGRGKVQEVREWVEHQEANLVIFNDELSPSQIRNLEEALECKVIDRTVLILDIFAQRARTREAQLQVEIAQLQYMLPRLIGLRSSLGRQVGGVGTHNRGAGETQLELDRRKIEVRIAGLNKELDHLVTQRQTQRSRRKKEGLPVVSLVGYTNAGKSTMMNALLQRYGAAEEKQVLVKDMLFATLDTSIRSITLPDQKQFLLSDTVGFVSKLPHHLVRAFRSTLEEAAQSDLLIHVVDYSQPNYQMMLDVTAKTLAEIGVVDVPTIYAYNKADLRGLSLPVIGEDSVYLSASEGVGVDELVDLIRDRIFNDYVQCDMLIPYDQGQLVSYFNEHATVLQTDYSSAGTKLTMECRVSDRERHQEYVI